jgi:hypothetical protein
MHAGAAGRPVRGAMHKCSRTALTGGAPLLRPPTTLPPSMGLYAAGNPAPYQGVQIPDHPTR